MQMTGRPHRSWCGRFQWPDRAEFCAGTIVVVMPTDAAQHEIEEAVRSEFSAFWHRILPDDVPRPSLVGLVPGAIHFIPEEEA